MVTGLIQAIKRMRSSCPSAPVYQLRVSCLNGVCCETVIIAGKPGGTAPEGGDTVHKRGLGSKGSLGTVQGQGLVGVVLAGHSKVAVVLVVAVLGAVETVCTVPAKVQNTSVN